MPFFGAGRCRRELRPPLEPDLDMSCESMCGKATTRASDGAGRASDRKAGGCPGGHGRRPLARVADSKLTGLPSLICHRDESAATAGICWRRQLGRRIARNGPRPATRCSLPHLGADEASPSPVCSSRRPKSSRHRSRVENAATAMTTEKSTPIPLLTCG